MILRKIIKIAATRCHILKLKCTQFDFGWGSATDPAGGTYSAPPAPQLDLKGLLLRGREGRGREGKRGQGRAGREREGREREKGSEGIEGRGGREGEWGSPTHYFRLKSCTVFLLWLIDHVTLIFDPLTLKMMSESRVTWATCVLIVVFLGSCSRFRPDVCDRHTDVRHASSLNAPALWGRGHNKCYRRHYSYFNVKLR